MRTTSSYLTPTALEAAFGKGDDDDRLVEELRQIRSHKSRRKSRAAVVTRILENTESPRVRNAAALALADMKMTSAKDILIEILRRPDTKGHRGTILYTLEELGADLPLSLIVDLILNESYESREEALGFITNGRICNDQDPHLLKGKLTTALKTADTERAHAVHAALEYLNADE